VQDVADHDCVKLQWDGPCARLTLMRAEKLNPLDWATVRELRQAVATIEARAEVSVVVVTGRGRSFSAGGDLEGYLGLELLLACDLAIAAQSARIGDGHLMFGQLPGAGGSQRLPRAVGLLRAKHLMLTGDLITADEACRIGLVGQVTPDADLDVAVDALVARLAEKSRAGLRGAKHLANLTLTTDLATGLRREIEYVHRYATTEPDATEGLVAFRDKRKPVFSS
jgi:enoyl-CoA hydratase/carnithine racemase